MSLQASELVVVREKGRDCSYGRVKRQEEQRSESVNDKPKSHTSVNTAERKMLQGCP
jgi:hypothetical protein